MKKFHNTMEKSEFVICHVVLAVYSMILYKVQFRCIGQCSLKTSKIILFSMILIISLIGGMKEYHKKRNEISIILNLSAAFGIYTIISYIQIRRKFIISIIVMAAVISCIYAICVMKKRIRKRHKIRKILEHRVRNIISFAWNTFCIAMMFIMVVFEIKLVSGTALMEPKVKSIDNLSLNNATMYANIDTLILLKEDNWKLLSLQKKLDVLQTIANIEQKKLGISNELNVGMADLQGGLAGYYSDKTHEVIISTNSLLTDSSIELVDTVCHEAYHSYQHRIIDAYASVDENNRQLKLYQDVEIYINEFEEYVDGEEDYCAYYNQKCEVDAREYAAESVKSYINEINTYFGYIVIDNDSNMEEESESKIYYDNGNMYLLNSEGERVAGPYLYIEEDIKTKWDKVYRYTALNGLIGYIDTDGKVITNPEYIKASKMNDGIALVSRKKGSIYYIDSNGKGITKEYKDGYPFECQGCFARVQLDDGKWGIIDRNDNIVFSGADSIGELPIVSSVGSAVVDGHAILFQLTFGATQEFIVIASFDQFEYITNIYMDQFAIVGNSTGLYGVVNCKGELVIPDKYVSIEYDVNAYKDNTNNNCILFKLQNRDGTFKVITKKFGDDL